MSLHRSGSYVTSGSEASTARMPWRVLAGTVPAIMTSGLAVGTASWLGRVDSARGAGEALLWWLQGWGAFAVWATILILPVVLLIGWPLDRATARLAPPIASLAFAALGFVAGAVAGYLILASIDAGLLGIAVVAPVGAAAGFVGRLLVEPLAGRPGLLLVLTIATIAIVGVGIASP